MINSKVMMMQNEQLLLRAPEPEDLDLLYAWENDPNGWENGITLAPISRFSIREHILEAGKNIYENGQTRLIIELKSDHKPIGVVDLFDFDPHHKRAGVGILIDVAYRRKGMAKKALQLLEEYAFNHLILNQLYCLISENNLGSKRLFESVGFQQSGLLKNWINRAGHHQSVVIYQCLASDFRSGTASTSTPI